MHEPLRVLPEYGSREEAHLEVAAKQVWRAGRVAQGALAVDPADDSVSVRVIVDHGVVGVGGVCLQVCITQKGGRLMRKGVLECLLPKVEEHTATICLTGIPPASQNPTLV